MKKHLRAMLEAIISDNTEAATKHFHDYLASTTRKLILGEAKDEDKDCDECDDDDKDSDDKKDSKKDKKENPFAKKSKKDKKDDDKDSDDDDKEDVKEGHGSSHPSGWAKNEKGIAYKSVPHKDDSEGYSNPKGKKGLNAVAGSNETGANAKKGNANKKPGKGKSEGYSNPKGKKGLGTIKDSQKSPDSDGKKDNRRTDKAKGYHGKSRGGKELG